MLAILSMLLSGVLSGGATGLLGVLLQRFFDMKNRQQDIELHKLTMQNNIELARMESEREAAKAASMERITAIQGETQEHVAEMDLQARESEAAERSLVASYEADQAKYLDRSAQQRKGKVGAVVVILMALVDFLRGTLRPGLTVYLTAIVTFLFLQVKAMVEAHGQVLTGDQAMQLLTQIIATILYCFTTCVVWWFGSRPPKQKGDR